MAKVSQWLTALLFSSLFAGFASGFDTGPHADLTRAVLAEHGFSEDGIKAVQLENWLTDYYSSSPTISRSQRADFEKLHFDNLFSTREINKLLGVGSSIT